jgi:hypothetical protein
MLGLASSALRQFFPTPNNFHLLLFARRATERQITLTIMRPLTEAELKTLVEKLATYCGKGISNLIADGTSDRHVFRIQVRCAYIADPIASINTPGRKIEYTTSENL